MSKFFSFIKLFIRFFFDSLLLFFFKKDASHPRYIYLKEKYIWFSLSLIKFLLNKFNFLYDIEIKNASKIYLADERMKIAINKYNLQLLHLNYPDILFDNDYIIDGLNYFSKKFKVKVSRVIDLGANIGVTSINLSLNYPDAQILSVEADQENFLILKENLITQNKIIENILAVNEIIGPKNKEVVFQGSLGEKSQIVHPEIINFDKIKNLKKGQKKMAIGLIDIMNKYKFNKNIDFIKIDIEGSEIFIFDDLIQISPKIVVIEFNSLKIEKKLFLNFINNICRLGYKLFESYNYKKITNLEKLLKLKDKFDIWIIKI